jgi:hypothetical protein
MFRRNASVLDDVMWENPHLGSILHRLGATGRSLCRYRRGMGSSGAPGVDATVTLHAWLEDAWAVMAASVGPVVLISMGEHGTSDVLLALQDRS